MLASDCLAISAAALRSNPLRSLLTSLGILIGVAAVVGISSLLNGMTATVIESFEGLGPRALYIIPHQSTDRTLVGREELTYEDAAAVEKTCEAVLHASPQVSLQVPLMVAGRTRPVNLIATIPEYQSLMDVYVDDGRFFTRLDLQRRRNVCVIGRAVYNALYKGNNVIGRTIKIDRQYFDIVGVLESRGQFMGNDRDDVILIPISTAKKIYGRNLPRRLVILAQARSIELVDEAIRQITRVLRKRHRIEDGRSDFRILSQSQILDNINETSMLITTIAAGIVGIALLVGGIGIMNTMLVSVAERAYEIGLRKAVGARRSDILYQFLIEAVTLSATGGAGGLLLGIGLGLGFGRLINLSVTISFWPPFIAFGFACSVGLFFGVYPASRAADLDPIQSLQR